MGKGCAACGPGSWMLSDELAQGSPAGVSASFPDGVREGGGGGIFRGEVSDRGLDECEVRVIIFAFSPQSLFSPFCLEETPRWRSWRGGTKTASWSARASCRSGLSTAQATKTKPGTTRSIRECGATPAGDRWEARSGGWSSVRARPTRDTAFALGCPGDAVALVKWAQS